LLFFCYQLHAGEMNVKVSGELRSFFFQRDYKAGSTDKEAFAVGGVVRGRIDPTATLTAGLSLYTSQGAHLNDSSKDVYNLLATDESGEHENYTALGEAFIDMHYHSIGLRLGRQEMSTPWVNLHDVRMTPQSFDSVTMRWGILDEVSIHLCYVAGMKYKTDTHAESMSETAGFGGNGGLSCLGIERVGEIGLQVWSYRAHDMWDDYYLRVNYAPKASSLFFNVRYLRRDSIGEQLAGNQNTWHTGITGGLKLGAASFRVAYSRNGQRTVLHKWGHDITISNQVTVADRADEKAWLLGGSYTPSSVPGLKLGISLAKHVTPDVGENHSPDSREYNFDVKYSLAKIIPGLSFRGRYARVREVGLGAEDLDDFRLYFRYLFDFD
jgi:hypothetical protein